VSRWKSIVEVTVLRLSDPEKVVGPWRGTGGGRRRWRRNSEHQSLAMSGGGGRGGYRVGAEAKSRHGQEGPPNPHPNPNNNVGIWGKMMISNCLDKEMLMYDWKFTKVLICYFQYITTLGLLIKKTIEP